VIVAEGRVTSELDGVGDDITEAGRLIGARKFQKTVQEIQSSIKGAGGIAVNGMRQSTETAIVEKQNSRLGARSGRREIDAGSAVECKRPGGSIGASPRLRIRVIEDH